MPYEEPKPQPPQELPPEPSGSAEPPPSQVPSSYYTTSEQGSYPEGGFINAGANNDPAARQGVDLGLTPDDEDASEYFLPGIEPIQDTGIPDYSPTTPLTDDSRLGQSKAPNPANQPQPSLWDRLRKNRSEDQAKAGTKNDQAPKQLDLKKNSSGGTSTPKPGSGKSLPSGGGSSKSKLASGLMKAKSSGESDKTKNKKGGSTGLATQVQDVSKAVELGAEIASGNWVGAAKNLLKNREAFLRMAKQYVRNQLLAWLSPFIIPVLIGAGIAVGIAIGIAISQQGNPVPTNSQSLPITALTSANPEGVYLEEMTPEKPVYNLRSDPKRKRPVGLLGLETTSGYWVVEEKSKLVGANRICWTSNTDNCLALASGSAGKYNEQTGRNDKPFTAEDATFYINARWPYHRKTFESVEDKKYKVPKGYLGGRYYAGQKVIIYNLDKKKAAVASIAEWGPEPWSGMCQNATSPTAHSSRTKPGDCEAVRTLWNSRSANDFRVPAGPPNYTGWVAGGPPDFFSDTLKFANEDRIVIGYAKDQNIPLGELKGYHLIKGNIKTSATKALNVPGIEEGASTQCGMASYNMVALYYISDKGNNRLPYASLPDSMKKYLIDTRSANNPDAWFRVNPNDLTYACNTPSYLNGMGHNVPTDWKQLKIGEDKSKFNAVIRSVQNGDPVIVYTTAGGWYSNSIHIYVLVGYDTATKEFIVNNPYPVGVQVKVKGGDEDKPAQTVNHLFNHRGELHYAQTFIIRGTYL